MGRLDPSEQAGFMCYEGASAGVGPGAGRGFWGIKPLFLSTDVTEFDLEVVDGWYSSLRFHDGRSRTMC